jgi:NADH-quinone oxidoreductase subunit G
MEAASLLHTLCDSTIAGSLCYFADEHEADRTITAISHLNEANSASMADVQAADLIGLINCNLLEDGPMMALAVRQAWRKGAKIYLVDDNSTPQAQSSGLGLPFEWHSVPSLSHIPLTDGKNPVVIFGYADQEKEDILQVQRSGAKPAFLLGGPNAFGAALLSREHGATTLSQAVAAGKVQGIIAVEADIPPEILEGIPFVAALGWRNTATIRAAHIVLPTTAWVEMDGTYINNEGRAQRFKKVMNPGLPIRGLDPALHPPRHHTTIVPGGDLHPAWKVVANIIERLGAEREGEPFHGKWESLRGLEAEGDGLLVFHKQPETQDKNDK